ncbi:diguanylate cyclase domain-containing protein [Methylomicrobium sp. RS1]|jgi:diguanylate cyclase (GGDEF)-like protein/PAS domain S-box-containing protein|uniref:diguanylate cyclase domain-containing protein n=1 Tax=Candidatus Methylomicrobium oryzae TaxID=2802053 RepID=UPI0019248192|nr:diguanylate cyclase [Methylomicrobium sp. RS1]MBL1264707.1 diguanylate cyclase [Methylomicrobium sp. RS1]
MPPMIALCLLVNCALADSTTEMMWRSQTSAPPSIKLTVKEKAWLAHHKKIRVAFDDSLPPYSFADSDGRFSGIAVDIFDTLSRKLDIRFEPFPRKSWNQLYKAAAERRVDVVATMVDRPERRLWFNFTHPYLTKSLALITRESDTEIKAPDDLARKTVAYPKGYQFSEGIRKKHPSIKPHPVESMLECLQSVSAQKADACITFVGTANYLQTSHRLTGIKFAGFYERHTADESIAVRGDWPILAGILQKGLDVLSEAEMNAIYFKWVPPPPELPVAAEKNPAPVQPEEFTLAENGLQETISPFLFLFVISYVWIWGVRVRRHIRRASPSRQDKPAHAAPPDPQLPGDFERMLLKRATDLQNYDIRFRNLIENQSKNYFFFQCDKKSKITYVSPSVTQMLGYRPDDFIAGFQHYITDNPENLSINNLFELNRQGIPCAPFALEVYDSGNERHWLEITSEPVYDEFGNCIGIDCLVFEITKRKQEDERLIWLSFHDELTGLANRRLFIERLQHSLAMANRNRMPFAVHYLDLDGFKSLNDRLGHAAGDHALKEVARKLMATLRDTDTAARFGGDEFALLLPDCDEQACASVAKKIVEIIHEPITYNGESIRLGVSIGIALYPRHADNCDALLRYADASMYHAKQKRLGYSFEA